MGEWMVEAGIAAEKQIEDIRQNAITYARECKRKAWEAFIQPVRDKKQQLIGIVQSLPEEIQQSETCTSLAGELQSGFDIVFSEVLAIASKLKFHMAGHFQYEFPALNDLISTWQQEGRQAYGTHLYAQTSGNCLDVPVVPAAYSDVSETINGYQVLNRYFNQLLENDARVVAFGEDVGQIGDVNQGFAGLQEKYGKSRVWDTGIREWTIVGQAIGLSMRGLRPIAEIQYLDYLVYGLTPLTDDLATLRYRSNGMQVAPAIIRTRGHRLEGIWHAGSPMGMLIHSLRGIHVCVPRNMVQAAGMYNTLLKGNEPGLIIECLNGYRLKEICPDNLDSFTVPFGMPEILQEGTDLTLVTYGSCVRIAQEALRMLEGHGIAVELIDVQTLLPFDLEHIISHSLRKTNRVLFLDEDVPGGATAYMMQEVLEKQNGYYFLDEKPVCLTSNPHRPAYGSDGDYFSKPNPADVAEAILKLMGRGEM
jgi:pyruvate/2-oxoglutarate/acetoin dehydrogenase E1 component